jgi:hypothetical protein
LDGSFSSLSSRQGVIEGERNTADASHAGIPVRARNELCALSVLRWWRLPASKIEVYVSALMAFIKAACLVFRVFDILA